MTRYAVLSDIHGNLESLQHALQLVDAGEVVMTLGDTVGYGPNPNECVRLIRARATHSVLGNHDLAAAESFGIEYFNDAAREAIAWTQGVLDGENRAWLDTLPYELRFPEFLLVHGAPVDFFEYILDKPAAAHAFARTDATITFVGHTHIAQYWTYDPDGSIGHRHMQQGGTLDLEPGTRYIIDVGSIGQPRDLNPEASFVRYDAQRRRVEWVRYRYPIRDVQQKIHAAHLPPYLAERLNAGR